MNYDEALDFAKDLANQAGEIMLTHFQVGVPTTAKANNTPVTIADTTINQMVIEAVSEKYPNHSVLGEEASNIIDNAEFVWVCDPIDGTINYSFGMAANVFALTLTHNGTPEISVVYDPHLKRVFTAKKGQGAYLNDQPIHVNNLTLDKGIVAASGKTSKVVDSPLMRHNIESQAFRLMILGTAVYEGMLVAAGQLAAHMHAGLHAHDVAATKLFVEEAGGRVTDLYGNDQRYDQPVNGIIASNGIVHDQLLAIVKDSLL